MLRRTALLVLNASLFLTPNWEYASYALLATFLLILHYLTQPFETALDNAVESGSLLTLLVLSILITAGAPPLSTGAEVAVSLIILLATAAFIAAYAFRAWRKHVLTLNARKRGESTAVVDSPSAASPHAVELSVASGFARGTVSE